MTDLEIHNQLTVLLSKGLNIVNVLIVDIPTACVHY